MEIRGEPGLQTGPMQDKSPEEGLVLQAERQRAGVLGNQSWETMRPSPGIAPLPPAWLIVAGLVVPFAGTGKVCQGQISCLGGPGGFGRGGIGLGVRMGGWSAALQASQERRGAG